MLLALLLDISGTLVEFVPPSDPDAVAEVRMLNFSLNGPEDDGGYSLSDGTLTVDVQFTWEVREDGADELLVVPPEGLTCRPVSCRMEVPENASGSVLLFDYVGY